MRVKRIEKEINRMITEANQVPDFVLNQARREMQNSTPTIYVQQRCYKHKFKPITIAMACLAIVLIIITSITLVMNSNEPNKPSVGFGGSNLPGSSEIVTCSYQDLRKKKYDSFAEIISDYHIRFVQIKNLETIDTYLYLLDKTPVMVEENYYFQDRILNYKMVRSSYKVEFKDDLIYSDPIYVNNLSYSMARKDDMIYLKTKSGQSDYYFSCDYYENYEEIMHYFWENHTS